MRSTTTLTALVIATFTALTTAMAAPAQAAPTPADQAVAGRHQVTMVTGDIVSVTPSTSGCSQASVTPFVKGEQITILCAPNNHLWVIPQAAGMLLGSALDINLIDITALIDNKYDDDSSDSTGITVMYADPQTAAAVYAGKSGIFGDTLTKKALIPSVNSVSGRLAKSPTNAKLFRELLSQLGGPVSIGTPPSKVVQIGLDRVLSPTV
jgi:hypothetical protein